MLNTSTLFASAIGLLASLSLSPSAQAQTAPAWTSAQALGTSIQQNLGGSVTDAAGNTYQAGYFLGSVTVGGTTLTSLGNSDCFLAKYTPTGTLDWVRQLGSTGQDIPRDIALDAAGNIYLTGNFAGAIALGNNVVLDGGSGTVSKFFVVRYSPLGVPEWAQQNAATPSGATAVGSGLGTDAAGNVYVGGFCAGSVTVGTTTLALPANNPGTFIARLNGATGALQSLTQGFYFAPGSTSITYPKLAVTATGETFLLNQFSQTVTAGTTTLISRGGADVVVAKFSALGSLQWAQQYGGTAAETVGRGQVDAAGNLYVAGSFAGTAQFDNTTLTSAGGFDGYLVKYSPLGTVLWAQAGGGPGSDGWQSLCLDAAGSPYVVGDFLTTATFGPLSLTSAGSNDISVVAYTPQGQVRWAQQAGGAGADFGYSLSLDARANLNVVGDFTGNAAFGPLALSSASPTNPTAFLARLGNSVLATTPARNQVLSFAPNPATDLLVLASGTVGNRAQFVDALGRVVRETTVSAAAQVSVRGLAPGLYTLRVADAQGRPYAGRVVVE